MSVSAEIITATCSDCAYYTPSSMYCMEWQTNGMRGLTEACGRFIPCEGSFEGSSPSQKRGSIERLSAKAKAVDSKTKSRGKSRGCKDGLDKSRKRDDDNLITRVAELLLQGKQRKEIAEKFEVSISAAARYIRRAVDEGKVVRLERGRYVAPGSPEATVPKKDQLNSLLAAKYILGGLTQAEIAEKYGIGQPTVHYHISKAVERGELIRVGVGEYEAGPALATDGDVPTATQEKADRVPDKAQTEPDTPKPDTSSIKQQSCDPDGPDHDHSSELDKLDKLTHRLDELQDNLQSDLLKLGEWAMQLDKRCDQLEQRFEQMDARIDKLEETVIRRFASLGLSVAGVQNDIVRVDQQLQNELERVVTNQRIISDQLDEVRDMVAEMQAEQYRRPGRVDASSDLVGRLLSVLETQQRIMERQLAGQGGVVEQRVVGWGTRERVEVEPEVKRANRTDNQEVA